MWLNNASFSIAFDFVQLLWSVTCRSEVCIVTSGMSGVTALKFILHLDWRKHDICCSYINGRQTSMYNVFYMSGLLSNVSKDRLQNMIFYFMI